MAGRGTTTFQKRQKEQSRNEKRQEKLARRLQKKQEGSGESQIIEAVDTSDSSLDRLSSEGESTSSPTASRP